MNPATLLLVIQAIQAAIAAAPGVIDIGIKAKDFVSSLFSAGLISKEKQDALHDHIDSLYALHQAGIVPPHWQVQSDPQ